MVNDILKAPAPLVAVPEPVGDVYGVLIVLAVLTASAILGLVLLIGSRHDHR